MFFRNYGFSSYVDHCPDANSDVDDRLSLWEDIYCQTNDDHSDVIKKNGHAFEKIAKTEYTSSSLNDVIKSSLGDHFVPSSASKISVSNLPQSINNCNLLEIFESFGPVKSHRLFAGGLSCTDSQFDNQINHSTKVLCGWVEYENAKHAELSCLSMNGREIHGKCIDVAHIKQSNTLLCMENIPISISKEELYTYFAQYGNVAISVLPGDGIAHNQGDGYVLFSDECSADMAIADMNAKNFEGYGNVLRLYLADGSHPHTLHKPNDASRIIDVKNNQLTDVKNRIIVTHLPQCDDKEIMNKFKEFGEIISCKVIRNYHGNPSIAFICFEHSEDAKRAVFYCNGWKMHNKRLKALPVGGVPHQLFISNLPRTVTDLELKGHLRMYGKLDSLLVLPSAQDKQMNRGYAFVFFEKKEYAELCMETLGNSNLPGYDQNILKINYAADVLDNWFRHQDVNEIYVSNLPCDVTDMAIQNHFSPCGQVKGIEISANPNLSKYKYAFVTFKTKDEAAEAIQKLHLRPFNRYGGNLLTVDHARSMYNDSDSQELYISNLPEDVNSSELMAHFSQYGNIVNCRLPKIYIGTGKGYAFMRFRKKSEAEEAVKVMDGAVFPGSNARISVTYASRNKFTNKKKSFLYGYADEIYVDNLPKYVSQIKLEQHFAQIGPVDICQIMNDSMASISYKNSISSKKAIMKLDKKCINGHPLSPLNVMYGRNYRCKQYVTELINEPSMVSSVLAGWMPNGMSENTDVQDDTITEEEYAEITLSHDEDYGDLGISYAYTPPADPWQLKNTTAKNNEFNKHATSPPYSSHLLSRDIDNSSGLTISISNLSEFVSKHDLTKHFSQYGQLTSISLHNKGGKQQATLTYKNSANAVLAREQMDGQKLSGFNSRLGICFMSDT